MELTDKAQKVVSTKDSSKSNSKRQPSAEKNHDSKRTKSTGGTKTSKMSERVNQRRAEQYTEEKSFTHVTLVIEAKPLPHHLKRFYGRKDSRNYSEKQKKDARKRKQDFANQVGWQKRKRRHRHQHQADRERQLINYMNGMPLDFDEDEPAPDDY